MLVLYGSVSMCGSGLHALTDSGISHTSPDQADAHAGPTIKALAGHCSICEFQAQGQLTVEPARVVSRPLTSPHVAMVLTMVATRDRHPSSSPRAPPFAISSIA
jgi:hypothetical protein